MPSFPKEKTLSLPAMRRLANGEACVECGREDGTVVAAHANFSEFGKGGRLKASDAAIMFLCSLCHHELDQGHRMNRAEKLAMTYRCIARTLVRLIEKGKLVLA